MSIMFAAGCRTVNSPTIPAGGPYVSTTIVGQITDESGSPLSGVAVQAGPLGNTIATTDANGLFALHNISVGENHAFIIAKKSGYFDGARAAIPTVNGVTYMELSMASSVSAGSVDAASGGTVTLPTGAKITLAPYGVVTSSGAAYSGTVTVYAKHFDPSATNFSNVFPGDLFGQQTDGSETLLQSFGVMSAELHDQNGNILQPAVGSPVTLTIPIDATLQSSAPASIPLWYFDEILGSWKQEGSATKNGNNYSGTVPHFCYWNYDQRVDYGTLTGVIVCNDVPIPGVKVNLGAYVESGLPNAITDGSGRFTVRIPANSNDVKLQVLAKENNGLYYTNNPIIENIPANTTTDVGQIALNSPCPNYLTGKLEGCNNQLTPGMVIASWPAGGISYAYTNDGNFKLIAPSATSLTLAATAASGDVAQPQTITSGGDGVVTPAPTIIACNGAVSDVQIDISGSFTGSALTFSPDGSKIATMSSNGTDVVVLDATTGNTISQFTVTTKVLPIAMIEFSPDGTKLLTLVGQGPPRGAPTLGNGSFDCWLINGTRLTATSVSANSAFFSNNGLDVFASSADSNQGTKNPIGVVDYNLAQAKVVQTFSASTYDQIAGTAAGGTQLILWDYETVYIWDIATDKSVGSFSATSAGYSGSMRTSADGSVLGIDNGSALYFYNTQSRALINTGTLNPSYSSSFNITPDDATYIGQHQAGGSNTVGLFKLTDGTPTHLFDAPASGGYSTAVAISPDGKLAAAVYATEIRVWKVN